MKPANIGETDVGRHVVIGRGKRTLAIATSKQGPGPGKGDTPSRGRQETGIKKGRSTQNQPLEANGGD